MAFRQFGGSPKKALPGEILLVIHDFEARSPDELTLIKGERIELIERDDDFGDGWYLGKHIQNEKTGLFPEVYTTTTPKNTNVFATAFSSSADATAGATMNAQLGNLMGSISQKHASSVPSPGTVGQAIRHFDNGSISPTPPPLNTTPPSQKYVNVPVNSGPSAGTGASPPNQRSIGKALANNRGQGEDSPVMNETLSVIDEHITDMNTPGSSLRAGERRGTNDSGSEYSSHIDQRLSYIVGNETDEEERNLHSRRQVLAWSPVQVAENLRALGVESRHCEFFKQQEITGEVLLQMDQETLFMPALDLGVVGRRLRTWHKIKALQDDVRGQETVAEKASAGFASDSFMNDLEPVRSRNSMNASPLPVQNHTDRPASRNTHSRQPSHNGQVTTSPQPVYGHHRGDSRVSQHSFPGKTAPDSPGRPSAASIRDLNHSRRQSAVDLVTPPTPDYHTGANGPMSPQRSATSAHKKTPSLDRNWTMGTLARTGSARPASAISMSTDYNTFDPSAKDSSSSTWVDRGYVSGSEAESKRSRNVLKKRDVVSASHSRNNSHLEDSQRASHVGSKRQSRFGSVDSIRDTVSAMASPASRMYHGNSIKNRFRNSSANEMVKTSPMLNTLTSPTVTKLEYDEKPRMSVVTSTSKPLSPKPPGELSSAGSPSSYTPSPQSGAKPRIGLRAISDAVTGNEKALISSPVSNASMAKESSTNSPARTGSTTPSRASEGLDRESTDASSKGTAGASTAQAPTIGPIRQKKKKDTSAYMRGLEQKSPQEQMVNCDYSGWMKKKSSNLMTTWKPRLFVLRGRRLSYFYSENDTQEKGLIDISSHRVLPADKDIFTGFHATVTGAKSSPVSPHNAHALTVASQEAAAQIETTLGKDKVEGVFIFKLMPPRSGLSRAVNFTKPTIHYFAVENVVQGRLWMAALMKATIDRDDTQPITTTYQQKTISLAKARMLRHRPPALMNLDEKVAGVEAGPKSDETGLNIQGVGFEGTKEEAERKRAESLSVEATSGAAEK